MKENLANQSGNEEASALSAQEIRHLGMLTLSRSTLETSQFFRRISPERQDVAVQALTVLGSITVSECEHRWNSTRWLEQWEGLQEEEPELINEAAAATSYLTIKASFKKLFHELALGVDSPKKVDAQKRLGKNGINDARGKITHTRQTPMGPASIQNR